MTTDALVLLKDDHKEVRRLFKGFQAENATRRRSELADEIVRALTVHAYLEDEVLYPRIRQSLPELAFEMRRAHQEHHVAEVLCAEIDEMDDDDPDLPAKIAVLADLVTQHIHTEEQDWFPKVRAAMGRKGTPSHRRAAHGPPGDRTAHTTPAQRPATRRRRPERMSRAKVLGPRAADPAQVETATLHYLMYGLLPAWTIPAAGDWLMHRRTRIQDNAGTRESLVHLLMMAEVGLPAVLVLLCDVDPPLLAAMLLGVLAHEATALWDVRTAQDAGREVTVTEQHLHSFLESLPYMASCVLACLHPEQVRELVTRAVATRRGQWCLTRRHPGFPARYLIGVATGAGVLGLLYGEELLRCLRAERRRRRKGLRTDRDRRSTASPQLPATPAACVR